MSLASLPHQEIDVVLWQGRGVDCGTKRFIASALQKHSDLANLLKRGGENG
jgi:hypothetical protein